MLSVRPHWWYLSGPAASAAAVIAGAVAAGVEGAPDPAVWVVLAVLAIALAWLLARYVRWSTTSLTLTSSRIIERRGVLGRTGREIPLSALCDIAYRQSLLERLIGAGDVMLESAGKDGRETFADLPHPARIHGEIYRQMERRRAPAPAPAASIPEQIDQLDQLRRRGVISDVEFDAKKAELLDRL